MKETIVKKLIVYSIAFPELMHRLSMIFNPEDYTFQEQVLRVVTTDLMIVSSSSVLLESYKIKLLILATTLSYGNITELL